MRRKPSKTSQLILPVLIIIAFIFFWFIFRNLYYSLWDSLDARTLDKIVSSPFTWFGSGILCMWLSRSFWRTYIALKKEDRSVFIKLWAGQSIYIFIFGLVSLSIGLVMLLNWLFDWFVY